MSTQAVWGAALLDPELPVPTGLLTWNGSDPLKRMAVYRNNVMVSLVDALASTFPVTQVLVGEAFFRAMVQHYVRRHPPRTPVLSHYGHDFADFVAQFPPAAAVPYLADVARLEYLRLQALHASDIQRISMVQAQVWLEDADELPQVICTLVPDLHPFHSEHAAVSVWAAHQADSGLRLEDVEVDRAEAALVFRAGLNAMVVQVSAATAHFVRRLLSGHPLGDALASATDADPEWDVVQALALLFRHGLITHIGLPTVQVAHG
jgi:hypothetical protein